jgi:hypothetical protein
MRHCFNRLSHGSAGIRFVSGPRRALRHLHEQLYRTDMGFGHHQCRDQESDEDLCAVPPAQDTERNLFGAGDDLPIRTVATLHLP